MLRLRSVGTVTWYYGHRTKGSLSKETKSTGFTMAISVLKKEVMSFVQVSIRVSIGTTCVCARFYIGHSQPSLQNH